MASVREGAQTRASSIVQHGAGAVYPQMCRTAAGASDSETRFVRSEGAHSSGEYADTGVPALPGPGPLGTAPAVSE